MEAQKIYSYLPIQTVVRSYMNRKGEKALTNFQRYLQIAIEGYSSIGIFEGNVVEVAYLTVNQETNTVQLPVDFITYFKIGVNINGRLWTLTKNDDMVPLRPETICAAPIETVATSTDIDYSLLGGYYFAPHYRYGGYVDTLYGLSGGFNTAYYKVDYKNMVIQFQGYVPNGEIILEYQSSNVSSGSMLIPRQATPAVRSYLDWACILHDPRVPMNEKLNFERLHNIDLYELKLLNCSFSLDEFLDNQYASYSQSIKR